MSPKVVHASFVSDPLWFKAPSEKLNSFIFHYRLITFYKQLENVHTVCVQTAEQHRWRHDVYNVQLHWWKPWFLLRKC